MAATDDFLVKVSGSPVDGKQLLIDAGAITTDVDSGSTDSEFPTAEAVYTAVATKVGLTGAEEVAGVKTFTSSPIVPVPTTEYQAANMKWVEDNTLTQSIVDAKGDLLIGLDDDSLSRIAVGTNAQVIVADSSETGGIKWVDNDADNVIVDASAFSGNLSETDTDVQTALDTIDALSLGTGDVTGPGSSTDNAIARYDSTTGKILLNSGVIIDDDDNITGIDDLTTTGNVIVGGQAYSSLNTLSDGASIATDCDLGNVHKVTLEGNRTLANPTNLAAGATYVWIIVQDGTGNRTLGYGTAFKWPSDEAPTLSTGAGDVDIITGVSDGTSVFASIALDLS